MAFGINELKAELAVFEGRLKQDAIHNRQLLEAIGESINCLTQKVEKIMSTIAEVKADFQQFVTDVQAAIAALQAQLASSGTVEASDLDALKTQIDEADAALKTPPAA